MPRNAHVKRIFKIAVNQDTGEEALVEDIYIDVLRIDRLSVIYRSTDEGKEPQAINYRYQWNDDKDNPVDRIDASKADLQYENANAKRKTEKRKIEDPDVKSDTGALPEGSSSSATSLDDNDIVLWIVKRLKVKMPQGEVTGRRDQIVQFAFNNKPKDESEGAPSKRRTSPVKIVNNDLGGMKMTREDEGGNIRAIIRDWETYRTALQNGKVDEKDELYLAVEFTDDFTVRFGVGAEKEIVGQAIRHVLGNNRAIEELFEAVDPANIAAEERTLIRIDPLQAVVNVGSNIIAVEFLDHLNQEEKKDK